MKDEIVKARISGQMRITCDTEIEMKRSIFDRFEKSFLAEEVGIDSDILLDLADGLMNGSVSDAEVNEFEIIE